MIENLKGIFEIVNFRENTNLTLYDNIAHEDYPPHWHTPLEIIMPIENIYTVTCTEQTFVLQENDIILICPYTLHALHAPEKGRRIIFQPDISILKEIRDLETVLSVISPVFLITQEKYPEIHPQIRTLLIEIMDEYEKNTPLAEAAIYSKFLSIIILIGRTYTENIKNFDITNHKQQQYAEKFIYICNYISAHCTDNLSLDDMASIAGFSKFHFTRLFKQFTNVSFYKYLNQKRIATAEKLLANPEYTITDVALNSGFSSVSSFIRMFKIIKNCTPTEFRSMHTVM